MKWDLIQSLSRSLETGDNQLINRARKYSDKDVLAMLAVDNIT